jgi:hypothetical protein
VIFRPAVVVQTTINSLAVVFIISVLISSVVGFIEWRVEFIVFEVNTID